jgi:N-terminal domain of (some) glycogen debranching enzymes
VDDAAATDGRQPFLHDRIITVSAPSVAISGSDGQMVDHGADGLFYDDRRALSRLIVSVPGAVLSPIHAELEGAAAASFLAVVRGVG